MRSRTFSGKLLFPFLIFFLISNLSISQTFRLSGNITDSRSGSPLEFASVKVAGTNYGTVADEHGYYFIRLDKGNSKIIFSYLGYFTDTVEVFIEDKDEVRNISLIPSEIFTETVDVFGEDPAYEIIRRAINYKKEFQQNLNEYNYEAYSKFVIRSNQSSVSVQPENKNDMKILAIMESESEGYFKKPDLYKQVIKSKRETANTTRGVAIPLIVNFYDEDIDLNEFSVPGPIADDAFDNYEYKLEGTTAIDSLIIYRIKVNAVSNNRPLFNGEIFISDSVYSLRRVDLSTNDAAKLRAIDKINFQQKFSQYSDENGRNFWMPSDIQIYADGSFAGLIKFQAEVFTVISDYEVNQKAPPEIFDEYVIKVLPGSKKDSSYWNKNQLIKNTGEEKIAYSEIKKETDKKNRTISLGLTSINYGKYFSSYPLNFYSFNRVEGSAVQFNISYRGDKFRNNADGFISYGFADKKMKYELNYTHRFFDDRRLRISGSVFKRLQPLSFELTGFSRFYNTMTSLFDKKDNLDYYYSSGYDLSLRYSLIPQFRPFVNYHQDKQTTAFTNTDYSIRKNGEPFKNNPPINDAFQRVISFGATIDPNKFNAIDWGDGDVSRFRTTSFPALNILFGYSGKNFNSTYEYRRYFAELSGQNYINRFLNFRYKLGGEIMNGDVPFQSLAYFNSNTGTMDLPLGFKAMKYQEFLGDRLYYLNFENNLGKILWSGLPLINRFNLIFFFNAGRSGISNSNFQLASFKNFKTTNGIYTEAGFGISRIFDLFRVDFAWRLNNLYKGKDRFFIGLSMDSF